MNEIRDMLATDDEPVGQSVVSVMVGRQAFGIDITKIEDVFVLQRITPVPLAPPAVVGILNLRGRVVTAISLRRVLGVEGRHESKRAMAVGVARGNEIYGLIVDSVGDVLPIDLSRREPVPAHLRERWARYATAIHKRDDGLLIELNADTLTRIDADALSA